MKVISNKKELHSFNLKAVKLAAQIEQQNPLNNDLCTLIEEQRRRDGRSSSMSQFDQNKPMTITMRRTSCFLRDTEPCLPSIGSHTFHIRAAGSHYEDTISKTERSERSLEYIERARFSHEPKKYERKEV